METKCFPLLRVDDAAGFAAEERMLFLDSNDAYMGTILDYDIPSHAHQFFPVEQLNLSPADPALSHSFEGYLSPSMERYRTLVRGYNRDIGQHSRFNNV